MNIGFDLDGVLYPWLRAASSYVRLYENVDLTEQEFREWINTKGQLYMFNLLRISCIYESIPAQKKDVEVLKRLAKEHSIFYVTNRPDFVKTVTLAYLRRYDFPSNKEVYFVKESKAPAIRALGCDFFVDDRVRVIEEIKFVTHPVIYTQFYNADYNDPLVTRISNLQEIEECLTSIHHTH